jgi:hypothetical protein
MLSMLPTDAQITKWKQSNRKSKAVSILLAHKNLIKSKDNEVAKMLDKEFKTLLLKMIRDLKVNANR